jgi:hypothetical protein
MENIDLKLKRIRDEKRKMSMTVYRKKKEKVDDYYIDVSNIGRHQIHTS